MCKNFFYLNLLYKIFLSMADEKKKKLLERLILLKIKIMATVFKIAYHSMILKREKISVK